MGKTGKKTLRAAVVGFGGYGSAHARKYLDNPDVELAAIVDCNPERLRLAAAQFPEVARFTGFGDLKGRVDIASVVVPAVQHRAVAERLLEEDIHLLVEKPFTTTASAARDLMALARKRGRVLQPGYLERFTGTLEEIRLCLPAPRYVEARRMTRWRERGSDVSVVHDLMIHDIDMLLELVSGPLVDVQARGVRIFSDQWDVVNARLRFAGGCVANLTASRASLLPERRLHVFSDDACALANLDSGIVLLQQRESDRPTVVRERCIYRNSDPLAAEIGAFVHAIRECHRPVVTAKDACRALEVAERITAAVEHDNAVVAQTATPMTDSGKVIACFFEHRIRPGK